MDLSAPIPDFMVDLPAAQGLTRATGDVNLDGMSITELLELRTRVEQKLPAKSLSGLNLEHELVLQVLALQQLQQRVISNEETPVNQVSQVANSLSAALTSLVKLQADVYSSERFKRLEQILISSLQGLPTEPQETFLKAYAAMLEDVR